LQFELEHPYSRRGHSVGQGDLAWLVAREYDDAIVCRLAHTLYVLGFSQAKECPIACISQKQWKWPVSGPAGLLLIEARQNVGLTVIGPASLVEAVRGSYCAEITFPRWAREQRRTPVT
jgi:hypothetical protein